MQSLRQDCLKVINTQGRAGGDDIPGLSSLCEMMNASKIENTQERNRPTSSAAGESGKRPTTEFDDAVSQYVSDILNKALSQVNTKTRNETDASTQNGQVVFHNLINK